MKLDRLRPIVLALVTVVVPAAANADGWDWTLTLYGWVADASVDVKVNDQEFLGGEVDFKDILKDTDFALPLRLEGKGDKFGVFGDLLYFNLGAKGRSFDVGGLEIEGRADPRGTLLDLGGVFYPGGDGTGFGLHAGVRLLDFKQTLDITKVAGMDVDRRVLDVGETLVDGLVGARYHAMFADHWSFAISGDVSGGGTEFTWGGLAVLGYHFGSRNQFGVRAGYRHLALRFKGRDRDVDVETTMAMSGPIVALSFTF